MKESNDKDILERVLVHFEQVAPGIVNESVDSLNTDKPIMKDNYGKFIQFIAHEPRM